MSEIIERVALAMRRRRFERTGRAASFDAELPLADTELDDARAAIAAMRSPTGAMVEAGAQGSRAQWGDHRGGKDGAERCWALMIDKALGSESP